MIGYYQAMARRQRCADAGYVYHVLNRAVGRATLFDKPADYAAFEKVLCQAWERTAMRVVSYVVMPNHWHLVVWPRNPGELSTWAQWLTVTHVRRWHAHHQIIAAGSGSSCNAAPSAKRVMRRARRCTRLPLRRPSRSRSEFASLRGISTST